MRTYIKIEDIRPKDFEFLKSFGLFKSRAWVAEIVKISSGNFKRNFLCAKIDYSESNSAGSRGIYKEFLLEYLKFYEISCPISWQHTDRYYAYFNDEGENRLTLEDLKECLK